jgi:hypothetical protein
VFRGAIGLFSFSPSGQTWGYSANTSSVLIFQNFTGSGNPPLYMWPQEFNGTGLTPALIGSYTGYFASVHIKDPRMTQWSVSIDRELGAGWVLHVNYIGSATSALSLGFDSDQLHPSALPYNSALLPYPNFSYALTQDSLAFSHYEALNPSLEHRFSNGLSLQANYTWAKSIGDVGGDSGTNNGGQLGFANSYSFGVEDHFGLRDDRGNDPGTRRQRFLLTALYELPFGKGRRFMSNANRVVDGVLGGWQLSTVTLVETGPFVTPLISAAYSQANLNEFGRLIYDVHPDRVGNGNLSNPTPSAWWDINAFVPTPAGAGRVGNSGVGILEAPGTVAIAGGASKTFRINEKIRVRIEATFTNLPNHPNFAVPPLVISSPSTFGQVVTTQSAENSGNRTGQLSGRIDF